jgi:hypothetical protein
MINVFSLFALAASVLLLLEHAVAGYCIPFLRDVLYALANGFQVLVIFLVVRARKMLNTRTVLPDEMNPFDIQPRPIAPHVPLLRRSPRLSKTQNAHPTPSCEKESSDVVVVSQQQTQLRRSPRLSHNNQ